MNESQPELIPDGGNRPQPVKPPPIQYDLAAMLKANQSLGRVLKIIRASPTWLNLELMAWARLDFICCSAEVFIDCVEAVDYSIRPPNAALIMGGPLMEFHEQHPLLEKISQVVPNTDGMETYDPPVKFGLLLMDQSYVIAGQFALRFADVDGFKNRGDLSDQQRQQRGLDWMEPFRLPGLTNFPKREFRVGE